MLAAQLGNLSLKQVSFLIIHKVHKTALQPATKGCQSFFFEIAEPNSKQIFRALWNGERIQSNLDNPPGESGHLTLE